jgi:hypothetical protein
MSGTLKNVKNSIQLITLEEVPKIHKRQLNKNAPKSNWGPFSTMDQ